MVQTKDYRVIDMSSTVEADKGLQGNLSFNVL